MPEITTTPHDHFFRETLARPGAARAFLQQYLPAEVTAALDLSEPEMVRDSFVDAELQAHRADLLYRVKLRDGREAYAYVLFEHKSIPDRWVAFQLLRYMVRIWERNLRERGKLWPIVPLVVYHGRDQWWVEPSFGELIDAPEPLTVYTPDYRYLLCDLTRYTDEELKGEVLLQAATLALKYVFRPEMSERLPDLMGLLRELAERETGLEYVETLLRYLAQAATYVEAEELWGAVEAAFPKEGEVLMSTIAQKWVEQGLQQGLEQGLEQGLQQGKREGVREGLLAGIEVSLEIKFGEEGLRLLPEIYKIEDVDVLRAVQKAIKTADTLDSLRRLYRTAGSDSND